MPKNNRNVVVIISLIIGLFNIPKLSSVFNSEVKMENVSLSSSINRSVNSSLNSEANTTKEVFDFDKFKLFVYEVRSRNILEVKDNGIKLSEDRFLVRGFRRFKKPFFTRLFSSYNYWYSVVDIEYYSGKLYFFDEWFDGDEVSAVDVYNSSPEPSKDVVNEMKSKIKELKLLP